MLNRFFTFFKNSNNVNVVQNPQPLEVSTVIVCSKYDNPLESTEEQKACLDKINARIKKISLGDKPKPVFTSLEAYQTWYDTREPLGRPNFNFFTMVTVPKECIRHLKLLDDENFTQIFKKFSFYPCQVQCSIVINLRDPELDSLDFNRPIATLWNDIYRPLITLLSANPVNLKEISIKIAEFYNKSSLINKKLQLQAKEKLEILDVYECLSSHEAQESKEALLTKSILNILSHSSIFITQLKSLRTNISAALDIYPRDMSEKIGTLTSQYLYPVNVSPPNDRVSIATP